MQTKRWVCKMDEIDGDEKSDTVTDSIGCREPYVADGKWRPYVVGLLAWCLRGCQTTAPASWEVRGINGHLSGSLSAFQQHTTTKQRFTTNSPTSRSSHSVWRLPTETQNLEFSRGQQAAKKCDCQSPF